MIYYILSRSSSYLAVAALLLLVLVGVVWNSLRRSPNLASPLKSGLYGAGLALVAAIILAGLMAASVVLWNVWTGSSAVDLLSVVRELVFVAAWCLNGFLALWASTAACMFFVFWTITMFTSSRQSEPRNAEQSLAAESR